MSGMRVAQVDVHIEDEVRDLLNHTCNGKISTELLRLLHVAAATGLQVAAVGCSINRCNIEDGELAGFRQCPAQLIARAHESALLVRARSVDFACRLI
jgi:hypothetical protein